MAYLYNFVILSKRDRYMYKGCTLIETIKNTFAGELDIVEESESEDGMWW